MEKAGLAGSPLVPAADVDDDDNGGAATRPFIIRNDELLSRDWGTKAVLSFGPVHRRSNSETNTESILLALVLVESKGLSNAFTNESSSLLCSIPSKQRRLVFYC